MPLDPKFIPKIAYTGDVKTDRKLFLEETIAFYGEDPEGRRAVEALSDRCVYRTEDGRGCALGRHIPDDLYLPAMDGKDQDGHNIGCIKLFNLFEPNLPEQLKALGNYFLNDVQTLHDGRGLLGEGDGGGLTELGSECVTDINKKYGLGMLDPE